MNPVLKFSKILPLFTLFFLLLDMLSNDYAKSQSFNENATSQEVQMMNIGGLFGMQDAMCISLKHSKVDPTYASIFMSSTIKGLDDIQPNKSIAIFSAQRSSRIYPGCGSIWPVQYRVYFRK